MIETPPHRRIACRDGWRVLVGTMATKHKTRTLRLADGGQFRIGPGTVSVPMSTVPHDPPAVVLHINRSCGALELEPTADGTVLPPVRLNAQRVVAIVEQINGERFRAAVRGEKLEPPIELPPTLARAARHVAGWIAATPYMNDPGMAGYPGKLPGQDGNTLWVNRETGAAVLERLETVPNAGTKTVSARWVLDRLTARQAVAWLAEHGYSAIPATLHQRQRTESKGAQNERPRKR